MDTLIYAARHGTTELNQEDRFRGPLDIALDGEGIQDAHDLADFFAPVDLSYVFASSKKRTMATAQIIADGMEIHANDGLWAWDVGCLAGKVKTAENVDLIQHYVEHPDEPIPQGESLNQFRARIRPLFEDALEIAMRSPDPILIVTHSSVIREIGNIVNGDNRTTLVHPGGAIAVGVEDGKLKAEPVFKPDTVSQGADTIS